MFSGFALALAWPETLCKQAGSWYDYHMHYLGINKKGYYKVGHSALVLVNQSSGNCQYFDFGRYHAPHGLGRVRSERTDNDLRITSTANFSPDFKKIKNLDSILLELYQNESTQGSGSIYGSTVKINFEKATEFINRQQAKEFIPYGPFLANGTNCSRFVNNAILSGRPPFSARILLQIPPSLTPTPLWNLRAIGNVARYSGEYSFEKQVINQQRLVHSTP